MGEVPTSLLEAARRRAGGRGRRDGRTRRRGGGSPVRRSRSRSSGRSSSSVGVVGGVAWANRSPTTRPSRMPQAAHATAVRAEAAHRATVAWLEAAVAAGIASRDAVSTRRARPPGSPRRRRGARPRRREQRRRSERRSSDLLEVDAPTAETVIPDTRPLARARRGRSGGRDRGVDGAGCATRGRGARRRRRPELCSPRAPTRWMPRSPPWRRARTPGRLACRPCIRRCWRAARSPPRPSKAAAASALAAVGAADGAALPALLEAYAGAATGVIAAHDAEVARTRRRSRPDRGRAGGAAGARASGSARDGRRSVGGGRAVAEPSSAAS